ncbi:MAG: hypothetical protein WBC91_15690 [Phototrophicaceae bacterium]
MGVKLDWDIEAEKGKKKEHREDSKQRSNRYSSVFRLFLTIALFAALLAIGVYLIFQRAEQVDQYTEQLLIDTVQAEVAALRLGDFTSFEARQRSATADWAINQREVYEAYQALKVGSSVILSGQVLNTEIEGQRGRVQVEEIIDGIPYVQTWFYWRYDEGWYHVPPDYTFWGASQDITTDNYAIRYRDLDTRIAQQIQQSIDRWLVDACRLTDCATVPFITIDILPAPDSPVRWADNEQNAWQLIVPSPYTERARSDIPLDTQIQIDVASRLSERVIAQASNGLQAIETADAAYLLDTTAAWLVGRFVQLNPETYFIQSLIDNHGIETVSSILQNLQATSSINIVASSVGAPTIADITVDWRDFVLWRLNLEDELMAQRNEGAWTILYDFTDVNVRNTAYQRYNDNLLATARSVTSATVVMSDTGIPQLIARVNVTRGFESGEEIIVFNLINMNWLRAN